MERGCGCRRPKPVQTHIDLQFADGTYRFALGLAQLHELQTKCKTGVGAIYARVLQGRVTGDMAVAHPAYAAYHIEDLVETVRQGLIGGAMGWVDDEEIRVGPMRANQLIDNYLHALPLMEQWNLAAAILHAKIDGYDPPKKKAVRQRARTTSKDGSTTPPP